MEANTKQNTAKVSSEKCEATAVFTFSKMESDE